MSKKKDYWTSSEDDLLLKEVLDVLTKTDQLEDFQKTFTLKHGFPWKTLSEKISSKAPNQCRERFLNYVCPGINKSEWTEVEDDVIRLLQPKYPGNWTKLSTHLKGRPPNAIKLRWRFLERKRLKRARKQSTNSSSNKVQKLN